ncbi:DUF3006 domain-containing protein [bacterium]|nr:DUF3006 domain-containing protein [candidate division CSSED10-310 bacterium]
MIQSTNVVVERIERSMVYLEINGRSFAVPVELLPEGAAEGSICTLTLTQAPGETARRTAKIKDIQRELLG